MSRVHMRTLPGGDGKAVVRMRITRAAQPGMRVSAGNENQPPSASCRQVPSTFCSLRPVSWLALPALELLPSPRHRKSEHATTPGVVPTERHAVGSIPRLVRPYLPVEQGCAQRGAELEQRECASRLE